MDHQPESTANRQPKPPDANLLDDCAHQLVYSALQKPITGASQIVDAVAGTDLAKTTSIIGEPGQAKFGTAQWHVEQVVSGVGSLVPFLAGAAVSRPLSRAIFEKGILPMSSLSAGTALERFSLGEAALTGFTANALFEPSSGQGSLFEQRMKQGAVGAIVVGSMQSGSNFLGKFTGASALESSVINKAITTGIAGGGAGILGGAADSLINGRPFDLKELAASGYSMAFTGVALSAASGHFMKLNMEKTSFPSVDEFVARNFDDSHNVEHYQAWQNMQTLSGKATNFKNLLVDTMQTKGHDLLERVGVTRPAAKADAYGETSPETQRIMKLTLPEMSPSERLMFVKLLEKNGKTPFLNEESLAELHDRLSETTKSWNPNFINLYDASNEAHAKMMAAYEAKNQQERMRTPLEEKNLMPTQIDVEHDQALNEWLQAKAKHDTEAGIRTSQLSEAIAPWLNKHGVPALELRNDSMQDAAYWYGRGSISVNDKTLSKQSLDAAFFGLLVHEIVHSHQDNLRIRLLADQMGIGKTATDEQLQVLNQLQVTPTVKNGGVDMQRAESLPFTQRVLETRQGKTLSDAERSEALQIAEEMVYKEPAWQRKAEAIQDQIAGTARIGRNGTPFTTGRFLDRIHSEPSKIKSEFGFSKIPKELQDLADARAAESKPERWNDTIPDQATFGKISKVMENHIEKLQKAYSPYAIKGYQQYMSSQAERQAYPAGLLAYLFARNKENSETQP
jgi:hypothetical protein